MKRTDYPSSPHAALMIVFRAMRREGDWQDIFWGIVLYPLFFLIATGMWIYYRPKDQ